MFSSLIRRTAALRPRPRLARRALSDSPYGAAAPAADVRKKVNCMELAALKRRGQRFAMVTAYDYPSALQADSAGVSVILVGDSVGMVELGYETTQPVTMDEMAHHCKAVSRGAKRPLLVGDMPFGSYEVSEEQALTNAYRFVKECGMDAVKIEGGAERAATVRKIVSGGVAVMGHVGLTPQAISVIGGFRAQGRTAVKARRLVDDALALQDAGAFAVVIECVPAVVAQAVTDALEIPTIGIGAGPHTTGQVLVYHDLLGMLSHPHHQAFVPKFCKKFADLGEEARKGVEAFREEVESGAFPADDYSPYTMSAKELESFERLMADDKEQRLEAQKAVDTKLRDADEYERLAEKGGE